MCVLVIASKFVIGHVVYVCDMCVWSRVYACVCIYLDGWLYVYGSVYVS